MKRSSSAAAAQQAAGLGFTAVQGSTNGKKRAEVHFFLHILFKRFVVDGFDDDDDDRRTDDSVIYREDHMSHTGPYQMKVIKAHEHEENMFQALLNRRSSVRKTKINRLPIRYRQELIQVRLYIRRVNPIIDTPRANLV